MRGDDGLNLAPFVCVLLSLVVPCYCTCCDGRNASNPAGTIYPVVVFIARLVEQPCIRKGSLYQQKQHLLPAIRFVWGYYQVLGECSARSSLPRSIVTSPDNDMIGSAPTLRKVQVSSFSSSGIGPIFHGGRICSQFDRISFEEFEFAATIAADHQFTCENVCCNFDFSFTDRA